MVYYRRGTDHGICLMVVMVWWLVLGAQVFSICQRAFRMDPGKIDPCVQEISAPGCGLDMPGYLIRMGGGQWHRFSTKDVGRVHSR